MPWRGRVLERGASRAAGSSRPGCARAFGWWPSKLAVQRLKEAVPKIERVARRDSVLADEDAVRRTETIWPAFEHVDSSSGALGTAVNNADDVLRDVPADDKTRDRWLERLFDAL